MEMENIEVMEKRNLIARGGREGRGRDVKNLFG